MKIELISRAMAGAITLAILAGPAAAQHIDIRSNSVVPVVMDDELSFKESRTGDRFMARVDETRDLPYGTRLEGHILDIQRKHGDKPAFMDVEFDTLILPDGHSEAISAIPIALNNKNLSRDRDGRLVAQKGALRKDQYVWGGVAGGALIGSIIGRKAFEGAVVGALVGIIAAEGSAKQEEVALKRGSHIGALFERDVEISFNGRWEQYGYNGDYNRRDPNGRYYGSADSNRYGQPNNRRNQVYNDDYRAIQIEFDGRPLRFGAAEKPYRMGGSIMVPLERTAGQMGLDVENMGRVILVEDADTMLRLEQDSDAYRLNGRRGNLARNVVKKNGLVYVPLEILASMKKESVQVNGTLIRDLP